MTREDLVDKIADHLCNNADMKTLLQAYYNNRYEWLDSLSVEELTDQALRILKEEVVIDE